ncbi:MAG: OmpA family protein [Methylobacter sp.]|nr:OmpA family protein [Methylobacter sp.]MDP2427812.1 OmpA family protein [Methylobacter sp.]MDP3053888.1 OmpA family protein [Methylobacter sp.]MDP3363844.1 OmpA family protein [Methylobacter sp.]MDZ4220999.1 OmpA family protein [Methylobacter sp.]
MNKTLTLTASLTGALLIGCTTQPIRTFHPIKTANLNQFIQSGEYQQKVDDLYVVLDASSSMKEAYRRDVQANNDFPGDSAATKFAVAKEVLHRVNNSIAELSLNAGIRSFGFGPCIGLGLSTLNYEFGSYSAAQWTDSLGQQECVSGGSAMSGAIEDAQADLQKATGKIALLLVSDGRDPITSPVPAMQALKAQYGDRLCVYSVWVGNAEDQPGQALLQQLSDIAGCGFAAPAKNIYSQNDFDGFAKNVFLAPAQSEPEEPEKPEEPVDGDDDQDGVLNSRDKCPGTPKGATVNEFGCWVIKGVNFDFDKSDIKPEYYPILDEVVTIIQRNPGLGIEVQGHTDNSGSEAYNQKLSERRANAIKDYLHNKLDSDHQLSAIGYGLTQPTDTNDTDEGRANNRRVELNPIK